MLAMCLSLDTKRSRSVSSLSISKKYFQFIYLLLITLIVINLRTKYVLGDVNQDQEFYNVADQSVKNAFTAISNLNVDKGSILYLVSRLNKAVETLDRADIAIRQNKTAISLSQETAKISLDIESEVSALTQENPGLIQNQRFIITTLEFLFATTTTYVIWIIIKRHYTKRILALKPEVIKNEH